MVDRDADLYRAWIMLALFWVLLVPAHNEAHIHAVLDQDKDNLKCPDNFAHENVLV